MESFIRNAIVKHMEENHLFTGHQHGFRGKHSCTTQLLEVLEHWSEILERGGKLDCIYLDFAKAFDTVPFKRLLNKLHAYGIRGKVHSWIESFLLDRYQQVRVGSSNSNWVEVRSGIPQGSVLGPTLFLLFINDLPDCVNNVVKLFADDTKIYRPIANHGDIEDLQKDLDSLQKWSDTWLLRFNAGKCKCLHVGKDNPEHEYKMNNVIIENVSQEKDLGVVFDSELCFNEHIALKVKKANQAVGMIRRTFTCMDADIFLPLFKSFVRPHLEYASVIWKPIFKKDILAIENVQRRATKMVTGLKHLTYQERLLKLGIPTLSYRRDRTDMIQIYKILQGYDSVSLDNIELVSNANRGHSYKLQKHFSKSKFGQSRFSNRVVNNWNTLSEDTVTAKDVNAFKSSLNSNWKSKDNKFSVV